MNVTADAIPVEWIKKKIEWLKDVDNGFSIIFASQLSALVNQWYEEREKENAQE